jgi:hypothetical protein
MELKNLKSKVPDLAKEFNIDSTIMTGLLELIEKGKIAKPEKLFKDAAPKLNVTGYHEFTYLNMGKKKYFFFGATCPLGNELSSKLSKVEKELPKSKDKQKELLEAQKLFLEEFALFTKKAKGYASGSIKYARSKEDEGVETCFMEVKKGFTVGKETKKKTLADDVNNIGYLLKAKNGQIMAFEPTTEEITEENDSTASVNSDNSTTSLDLVVVKKQVQQLLGQFKALEPNKAFKGLGLIHSITSLIGRLDEVPENLKVLAKKLEAQQSKIKPIFSKQIDQKMEQSMGKLEKIPSINSSDELADIFGTIQKMYEGWKKFLPEEEHPKGAVIEKVNSEVDILKDYEAQIVPLRKQHAAMDNSEEKEQLAKQINALINEARTALA